MREQPGLELIISERSKLFEPFTDLFFEKKDGVWTRTANMVVPTNSMIVQIDNSEQVFYSLDTRQGVQADYDDHAMSFKTYWIDREELYGSR